MTKGAKRKGHGGERANRDKWHRDIRIDHMKPKPEGGEPGTESNQTHDETSQRGAGHQKGDRFKRKHGSEGPRRAAWIACRQRALVAFRLEAHLFVDIAILRNGLGNQFL